MYQLPRHSSPRTVRPFAAFLVALVTFLAFALSLTNPGPGGGVPLRQPPHPQAGFGL